jgi:hypothetical protein
MTLGGNRGTVRDPPEADWKRFRALRQVALDRFCTHVLQELGPVTEDPARSSHERYLGAFQLLRERDRQLSAAFDDPRRSHMVEQLAAMHAYGLLEPGELDGFSSDTRDAITALAPQVE